MYETLGGARLTLYAVPTDSPVQTSFRFHDDEGLMVVTWREVLWRYALVGALDRAG
ncbi:hypothetical protein [Pseudoruegeria sp. HB172150]|uniref:hypothetical protein n=1 Tax=Pseudoruegeria sp. HB172150 TaxID=2721164 RepID=UPI001C131D9A|nr:hypothetical protein [Pseudoruegeria sp. HB172150]